MRVHFICTDTGLAKYDPYLYFLNDKRQAKEKLSSDIFKVFGITRPGIEPTTKRTL